MKKTIKEKLIAFLHDGIICILSGIAIAIGVMVLLALISGIVAGFELYSILNVIRSGLLIVGAILLFVVAGVMLGQKSNNKIRSMKKWKTTFYVFGPTAVFLLISISVLMIATIIDYIVWLS